MESMQEKIPDYLAGRLDPEATKTFETALAKDSELQREVDDHQKVVAILERERKLEAKRQLIKSWMQEEKKENKVIPLQPVFRRRVIGWAAAAAAAVVLFFFWNTLNTSNPQLQQLAQNYYSLEEHLGPAGIDAVLYLEGFNFFDNKQYRQAIDTWAGLSPEDGKYFVNALYLSGHAFLNLPNGPDYRAAAQRFSDVLSRLESMDNWITVPNQPPRKIDREDVEWYLALSYLGQGRHDRAVGLLETLTQTGKYQQQARSLLEAIRQL